MSLQESDLRALLADPRVPEQRIRRGDEGFRYVLAWRLVALAEARVGDRPELEAEVDALIERSGGRRLDVVDPWRWIPDAVRRLRRQPRPPRDDVYEIPERLFPADDDASALRSSDGTDT